MHYIVHSDTPPPSIVAAHRAEPHPTNPRDAWDRFDARELREHLWELQFGLCAYCERALELGSGTASIEHILPKTANPLGWGKFVNPDRVVDACAATVDAHVHAKTHGYKISQHR